MSYDITVIDLLRISSLIGGAIALPMLIMSLVRNQIHENRKKKDKPHSPIVIDNPFFQLCFVSLFILIALVIILIPSIGNTRIFSDNDKVDQSTTNNQVDDTTENHSTDIDDIQENQLNLKTYQVYVHNMMLETEITDSQTNAYYILKRNNLLLDVDVYWGTLDASFTNLELAIFSTALHGNSTVARAYDLAGENINLDSNSVNTPYVYFAEAARYINTSDEIFDINEILTQEKVNKYLLLKLGYDSDSTIETIKQNNISLSYDDPGSYVSKGQFYEAVNIALNTKVKDSDETLGELLRIPEFLPGLE